jgi:hypothetical protein
MGCEYFELGAMLIGCSVAIVAVIVRELWRDHQLMKKKEAWRKAEKWNWD